MQRNTQPATDAQLTTTWTFAASVLDELDDSDDPVDDDLRADGGQPVPVDDQEPDRDVGDIDVNSQDHPDPVEVYEVAETFPEAAKVVGFQDGGIAVRFHARRKGARVESEDVPDGYRFDGLTFGYDSHFADDVVAVLNLAPEDVADAEEGSA